MDSLFAPRSSSLFRHFIHLTRWKEDREEGGRPAKEKEIERRDFAFLHIRTESEDVDREARERMIVFIDDFTRDREKRQSILLDKIHSSA